MLEFSISSPQTPATTTRSNEDVDTNQLTETFMTGIALITNRVIANGRVKGDEQEYAPVWGCA